MPTSLTRTTKRNGKGKTPRASGGPQAGEMQRSGTAREQGHTEDLPALPLREELGWAVDRARAPRLRTMREFAEQEIVIPTGPFEGRRFRCHRQPANGLWFDAVDSGRWPRMVATGPSQASKSLVCYIIPALYHLFECGERIILFLPDMRMASDKWVNDLLPVIKRTRFAGLLPTSGRGSRGGDVERVDFENGASIKWMSGGGGDKRRAGYTARVVIGTELDAMDESGGESREADKITQVMARTRAYGPRARFYGECTLTTEEGRTHREIVGGTDSRIALPCPHCRAFVTPGRENVKGWEDAESVMQAGRRAQWHCPQCDRVWTEDQRRAANQAGVLVHRGQTVRRKRNGEVLVQGEPPDTDTLGFRWSAVHNMFLGAGQIGADLWNAARDPNEDNAERSLCQFVFAVPYKPPKLELSPLSVEAIQRRTATRLVKGMVPGDVQFLTAGVDVHQFSAYYMVVAWRKDATSHIVDYGIIELPTAEFGLAPGILMGLREWRKTVLAGWAVKQTGGVKVPDQVWIDEGWTPEPVKVFCRESVEAHAPAGWMRFRPSKGHGVGQQLVRAYTRPKKTGALVVHIGQGYHLVRLKAERTPIVHVDADHWKSFVRDRLSCPAGAPGAMTIYHDTPRGHMKLSMHLTAEQPVEEYKPGVGRVVKWVTKRSNNQWSDALYQACAAAHLCGVRLMAEPEAAPGAASETTGGRRAGMQMRTPDGRPFVATRG